MYENAEVAVNFWKIILPSDEYDLLAVEARMTVAASKMAAIAPAVQTLIDDLFGQWTLRAALSGGHAFPMERHEPFLA